jgi:hypothetical protein
MVSVDPGRGELEQRIRQAAGALDFRAALEFWNGLSGRLEQEMKQCELNRGDLERVGELVRWVREVAIAAKGQATDRLTGIRQFQRISEVYGATGQCGPAVVRRSL